MHLPLPKRRDGWHAVDLALLGSLLSGVQRVECAVPGQNLQKDQVRNVIEVILYTKDRSDDEIG